MTINISAASELMKNNLQASIMSPQKNFQALQTAEGHTLFFSIGTDDIFYLTREVPGNEAGWTKTDLSSVLKEDNNDVDVIAKTFMVAQNLQTNKISIVLAVQGESQDFLYTALSLDNTDATWENPITWNIQAYDDALHPLSNPLSISQVYLSEVSYGEYIIVDIVKDPDDPNQFISTYFLDTQKAVSSQVWNEQDLAVDLNSENVKRDIGIKKDEWVYGTYTLGTTVDEKQLVYTPFYNVFNTSTAPAPSNLVAPTGASCIAAVENVPNYTSLFVSGDQSLYYFPYDGQNNGDAGQLVLEHELFLNVTQLYANCNSIEIVVWGLNQQGQVFYTKCPIGQETDSTAWSVPSPILSNTTQIATYLNNATTSKVLFAYTDGTNLIKLAQDPLTSLWAQSDILLPSTDMDDVIEYTTYTTHIQVSTEDNLPKGDETILVSSTSPVSVYINNKFTILSPTTPIPIQMDSSGIMTILQSTDSIGCVCYNLELESTGDVTNVNPMSKVLDTISGIQTGEDLANLTVTNADGTTQALMPSSLTEDELDAIASALQEFVTASESVPSDGSTVTTSSTSTNTTNFAVQNDRLWGLSFKDKTISYHSGDAALAQFGLERVAGTNRLKTTSFGVVSDIGDAIESTVGDIVNWVEGAWDDVTDFFMQVADDIYNCFITIAGKLYTFALNCLEAVLSVIQLLFDKIGLLIEDLIKWVGFLFQWGDILRTKDVMKNVVLQYMNYSTTKLDSIQSDLDTLFTNLEAQIDEWANIDPPSGGSLSSISSDTGEIPGQNDPQSNFGVYHMNNGIQDSSTSATLVTSVTDSLDALFQIALDTIQDEAEILEDAFNQFKTQVIDQITTLDISEIIKRSFAILSNTVLESIHNVLNSSIEILEILIDGVIDLMSATIDIPVLSWLYKDISGDDLSVLDAGCLLIAIPATLLYKIARNDAPFDDNATTDALINAASWEELQNLINPPSTAMAKTSNAASDYSWSTGDIIMVTARYGSVCGSLFLMITSTAKKYSPVLKLPISLLNGIAFFGATIPTLADMLVTSSKDRPDLKASRIIYVLTCLQRLADVTTYNSKYKPWIGISAAIDTGLGFINIIFPFAPVFNSPSLVTISGALTSTVWNGQRILAPIAVASNTGFGIKTGLIGLYGVGQAIVATEIVVLDSI